MFEGAEVSAEAEAVIVRFQSFLAAIEKRTERVAAGEYPVEAVSPYVAAGEGALRAVERFVWAFYPDGDYESTAPPWVAAVLASCQLAISRRPAGLRRARRDQQVGVPVICSCNTRKEARHVHIHTARGGHPLCRRWLAPLSHRLPHQSAAGGYTRLP